jgi:hypothetical protein
MPYPSMRYPHVFGVRLSDADRDKLQRLADDLGLLPCQALRLLVRHATDIHTQVIFTPERCQDTAYVPSD